MATPSPAMEVSTREPHVPVKWRICLHRECWAYWRLTLKVSVILLYLIILCVCLPLLIWELIRQHAETRFSAWFVAGIFVLLTLPIFLWGLLQHLLNYTQPHLQKHIIRLVVFSLLKSSLHSPPPTPSCISCTLTLHSPPTVFSG